MSESETSIRRRVLSLIDVESNRCECHTCTSPECRTCDTRWLIRLRHAEEKPPSPCKSFQQAGLLSSSPLRRLVDGLATTHDYSACFLSMMHDCSYEDRDMMTDSAPPRHCSKQS